MPRRASMLLAVLAFALAIGSVSFRVQDQFVDPDDASVPRYALGDFRDAVYYATVAFFVGDNPYDQQTYVPKYPVGERCSLYSPLSFILHAPLALLSFRTAALVFYLATLALTVGLGALCLSWAGVAPTPVRVLGLGAFLIASRPGSMNLFNGQVTVEAVLATYLALWHARGRPWLAAAALAVATFKGTYGVPLAILMWLRGDRRAVLLAVMLGALVTVPATARLTHAVGGVTPLVQSLRSVYDSRSAIEHKRAERAPFRIDVVALTGRLLGRSPTATETGLLGLGVFGMAAAGLWTLRRREVEDEDETRAAASDRAPTREAEDARLLATSLATLAVVAGLYHQAYDALALTLPLVMLCWRGDAWPWRDRPAWRWVTMGLVLVPFANFLSAEAVIEHLRFGDAEQLAASSVSAVCLLMALGIHVMFALRAPAARPVERHSRVTASPWRTIPGASTTA